MASRICIMHGACKRPGLRQLETMALRAKGRKIYEWHSSTSRGCKLGCSLMLKEYAGNGLYSRTPRVRALKVAEKH
eukprot:6184816-Pleurochrysis_carterae.AAC.1